MSTTDCTVHFHAGTNEPGYLPDSEPDSFTTWEDAQRYIIGEMLSDADSAASWNEPHDCDDVPCPTFGGDCPESKASELTFEAEELNLDNGPDWSTITAGRSYWIHSCGCAVGTAELAEDDESDEDDGLVTCSACGVRHFYLGMVDGMSTMRSLAGFTCGQEDDEPEPGMNTLPEPCGAFEPTISIGHERACANCGWHLQGHQKPECAEGHADVWQLLEQSAPEGCEAVQDLYSWSLNYDPGKGPFGLFLDLTGWSEDNYGSDVYDIAARSLGYVELSKLAAALEEYSTLPATVHEYVSVLLDAATA